MAEEKNKDVHIWLPPAVYNQLKSLADMHGLSLTAQCRMLLLESLRRQAAEGND